MGESLIEVVCESNMFTVGVVRYLLLMDKEPAMANQSRMALSALPFSPLIILR